MAQKKNAGFYARGAVPRRSADRKADHVLRPIFERRKTMANEVNCCMIFKEGVE